MISITSQFIAWLPLLLLDTVDFMKITTNKMYRTYIYCWEAALLPVFS